MQLPWGWETKRARGKKQIRFGNDRKKGKSKSNGQSKCKSKSKSKSKDKYGGLSTSLRFGRDDRG